MGVKLLNYILSKNYLPNKLRIAALKKFGGGVQLATMSVSLVLSM